MRWTDLAAAVASIWNRIRAVGRTDEFQRDLDDELSHHRTLLTRDLQSLGHRDAARDAAIRLGNRRRLTEEAQDVWRFHFLSEMARDLRYATRQLRRAPVVSTVAVVSLALGVGLNASMFSALHDVLLRQLPVTDPQSLRVIGSPSADGTTSAFLPWPMVELIRDEGHGLSGVAATGDVRFLGLDRGATRVLTPNGGAVVSGGYFDVLGVRPELGRLLHSSDDRRGEGARAVVLSHDFWTSQLGADTAVVGRALQFNGQAFTVVGVTPRGFTGVSAGRTPDAWFPITTDHLLLHRSPQWRQERTNWWLQVFGRVRPGVADAAITSELTRLYRRFQLQESEGNVSPERRRDIEQSVLSVSDGSTGMPLIAEAYGRPLRLLFLLSCAVLMLACANVASLQIGRLHARQRELGVRMALGASAGRLARHLLAEGAVVALLGAVCGLALQWAFGSAARGLLLPLAARLSFPGGPAPMRVVFGTVVVLAVTLLVAAIPALVVRSRRVVALLGTRGDGAGGRARAGRWLTATQFALALPLVVTSTLLARSLIELRALPMGFDASSVALLRIDGTRNDFGPSRRVAVYRQVMDGLATIPGVRSVSAAMYAPLSGSSSRNSYRFEGSAEGRRPFAVMHVDPGYFATLGVPLDAGREFERSDDARERRLAIVSAGLARRMYGSPGAALGRRMARSSDSSDPFDIEIVGVAPDARLLDIRDEAPEVVYQPFLADSNNVGGATLLVSLGLPLASMTEAMRRSVQATDPSLEVLDLRPLQRNIDTALVTERTVARLTLLFGGLALLLAALGLYATCAQDVTRRSQEFGVRLALGASPARLRRWILRDALMLLALGAAAGLPLAYGAARAARTLLYGHGAGDPRSLAAVAVLLAATAILAVWIPARRAARMDPLVSLRRD